MRRILMMLVSGALVVVTGLVTAPHASAGIPERAAAAACTARYEVVGKKVAVRKPTNNAPVAAADSPVVRYLHRGDVVRSCVAAIARTESGPAYRKCGRGGHVWRVVRGGQAPATCLRKL
ncbi:hypothetical protein [Streptomyces sp. NPDC047065]|uniref:hypothetical protein n=1 Tax=Streptomyces sp. NPDC047065 TaxID=3154606 RepID=UPI0033F1BC48